MRNLRCLVPGHRRTARAVGAGRYDFSARFRSGY